MFFSFFNDKNTFDHFVQVLDEQDVSLWVVDLELRGTCKVDEPKSSTCLLATPKFHL